MRAWKAAGLAAALLALLSACETKQSTGTAVGAVGGAAAGYALGGGLLGTAAGALLGGLLGNQIGKQLDREDVARANQANQQALERNRVGQATAWSNPNTGHSGTVMPTSNAYVAQGGATCREFEQTVSAGGSTQSGTGRACRQADGSWKVVN